MTDQYYTVDQVAAMLGMHKKTIQRYIREGRLKANKVGKGWRISGHELSVFTEGTAAPAGRDAFADHSARNADEPVKVSAVVDIPVPSRDEAMRIVNTITAALNAKPAKYGKTSMAAQYLESEGQVRLMLWGPIQFMEIMLGSISALTNPEP